jgi:hypothetical protein
MIWFTSDWHLGETRLGFEGKPNVFFRPFSSIAQNDSTIIDNINAYVKEDDTLYHLGDVLVGDSVKMLDEIKCKDMHLITGNYDYDKIDLLKRYFKSIQDGLFFDLNGLENLEDIYNVNFSNLVITDEKDNIIVAELEDTDKYHEFCKERKMEISYNNIAYSFSK